MIVNNPDLSPQEFDTLKYAIAQITVLIAGADGHIDSKELSWAEKITEIRSYNLPDNLGNFYKEVGKDFHDKVEQLIAKLPSGVEERTHALTESLLAVNGVLAKLPVREAAELYQSYLSFAKHVAKASGGFLGFFRVTYEESHLMDLPMIAPVYYHEG